MIRLLDTASRRVSELHVGADGRVGMYVCGPTVYGPPHVGHGRLTLVFDVLRRYLEHRGVDVLHVSNVTDVDDKIIERANSEGRSPTDVAAEAEEQWWSAMDRLGVAKPHAIPHATDYVSEMIEMISALLAKGAAYVAGDGVYLSVAAVPDYGLLPHQDPEEMLAGARVEAASTKRAPADFALWKAAKPGEPTWQAPFGPGRPGWHTECVVMSLALLGEGFSLHGGGRDLIFPHHENERAQAVALGGDFARQWMHNGMVVVGGEKMSKSLGNVLGLAELLAGSDARAYRMLVLRSHYRSPIEVVPHTLDDAARQIERIDALARRLEAVPLQAVGEGGPGGGAGGGEARGELERRSEAADELARRFEEAMDDDLDTPGALAGLFDAIRRSNAQLDAGDATAGGTLGRRALALLGALGVAAGAEETVPSDVLELARSRDAARARHDFAAADRLRAEIEHRGWQVEDTPSGAKLRRRSGAA